MTQLELGLNLSTRRTRRAVFLDEMNLVVPWTELLSLIALNAPRAKTGRPPFELVTMLRIHLLQQWFSLSDLVMEEALFEMRCTASLRASPASSASPTGSASCAFATCSKNTNWPRRYRSQSCAAERHKRCTRRTGHLCPGGCR